MTTASGKAKGRKLQQLVRDRLRVVGSFFGLVDGDVESRGMGQSGADVILSPAAEKIFGRLSIECKNCENLNVRKTFFEHAAKYPDNINLLIHKRNKEIPLVTMTLTAFMYYFGEALCQEHPISN